MESFDVSVYAIRRRAGRRRPFEVRWRTAGQVRSRSFTTRALADSYRAELIRAARKGLAFDSSTGEPASWAESPQVTVSWYQHAAGYAAARWPELAARSRASLADALATLTPALVEETARGNPGPGAVRAALYRHAFNPARPAPADGPAAPILDWIQRASLPIGRLAEPAVLRTALDALTIRSDGSRAAANTVIRKHAVFHSALTYAVENGLLADNPLDKITWHVPRAACALAPAAVAGPAQAAALPAAVAGYARTWRHSSAVSTTLPCAPKKRSPCARRTACSQGPGGACSP
jgi:hypothetical protein